jgi:hypothetical protein
MQDDRVAVAFLVSKRKHDVKVSVIERQELIDHERHTISMFDIDAI